jgi:uncharacterized membrane protein YsdA (DUF1294 family)
MVKTAGTEKMEGMVTITVQEILLVLYAAANIYVFLVYACDKTKARDNARRTPEGTLLVLSLIGPFGAYAAMRMFRHKTQKIPFLLVPGVLIIHVFLIAYLLSLNFFFGI